MIPLSFSSGFIVSMWGASPGCNALFESRTRHFFGRDMVGRFRKVKAVAGPSRTKSSSLLVENLYPPVSYVWQARSSGPNDLQTRRLGRGCEKLHPGHHRKPTDRATVDGAERRFPSSLGKGGIQGISPIFRPSSICHGRKATQAHHLTYERVGKELPGDLTAVCRDCHRVQHPHLVR
jgi:hypothetical protein